MATLRPHTDRFPLLLVVVESRCCKNVGSFIEKQTGGNFNTNMRSASSPRRSPSSLLLCLIHICPNHNFWPIRSLWKLNWKKVFQHSLLDSTQPLSQNFGQRITHSKILFGILLQRKLGHHRLETVSLQCIEVKGQLYVTCMIYIVYLQSDTDTCGWVLIFGRPTLRVNGIDSMHCNAHCTTVLYSSDKPR